MYNPHLETILRKKSSHFQGTGATQQELNYLISFILHYHSYFSKNCMVEPHPVLLDNEKNFKILSKRDMAALGAPHWEAGNPIK